MKNIINELWHGNIIPQEDSRTNSKEIKELLGYTARHHEGFLYTILILRDMVLTPSLSLFGYNNNRKITRRGV